MRSHDLPQIEQIDGVRWIRYLTYTPNESLKSINHTSHLSSLDPPFRCPPATSCSTLAPRPCQHLLLRHPPPLSDARFADHVQPASRWYTESIIEISLLYDIQGFRDHRPMV